MLNERMFLRVQSSRAADTLVPPGGGLMCCRRRRVRQRVGSTAELTAAGASIPPGPIIWVPRAGPPLSAAQQYMSHPGPWAKANMMGGGGREEEEAPEAELGFSHRLSCSIPQSPGAPTLFLDSRPPGPQCSSQIAPTTPSIIMIGRQPFILLTEGKGNQLALTPSLK